MTTIDTPTTTNGAAVDRYGYPLTTDPEAAAAYRQGIETLLAVQPGASAAFDRAVDLDPRFALGHIGRALAAQFNGDAVDVPGALAAAENAVRNGDVTRRERQHVEIVTAGLGFDLARAGALTLEHLREYPCDIAVAFQMVMAAHFTGDQAMRAAVSDVTERLARHHPAEDWAFAAVHAFVLEEDGDYERAEALARSSLAGEPRSGQGAHVLAHVLYETGRYHECRRFLVDWLDGYPEHGPVRIHLQWHAALAELALDERGAAFDRYRRAIAPPTVGPGGLFDGASLLWRLELGRDDGWRAPWEDLADLAAPGASSPGWAFADLHVAIALAGARRTDELGHLRDGLVALAGSGHTGAGVVVDVIDGLTATAAGDWTAAVAALTGVSDERLTDVGGSHAQRAVVAETLDVARRRAHPSA